MPIAIDVQSASKRFGSVEAIADVTLSVAAGEFVALVGPSGCGKTTLLRLLGGMERLDGGTIRYRAGGHDVARGDARLSYCFQEPRLLAWRTSLANVALPLEIAGLAPDERRARARAALTLMRVDDAEDRLPHQLSGGMKMRVAMARALVTRPDVLLLDEPFGALDEVTRNELDEELLALRERQPMTIVLVTHSIPEAVFLADRVDVLSRRPATVTLSERIALPERRAAIRTSDSFNLHVRHVSDALERTLRRSDA